MNKTEMTKNMMNLLEKSTSAFHTVKAYEEELAANGFQKLELRDKWNLERGGKYIVNHHGTAVFAFTVGKDFVAEDGFRLAAAHGDFPGFRIKPNPDMKSEGYLILNTEVYGGVNLSSWMDRPLSVAGRVALKSDDIFHPTMRLIDCEDPIMVIPNSAIHLLRELGEKGAELNKQVHMAPVMGSCAVSGKEGEEFVQYLADKLGVAKEEILEYELNIYNPEKGCEAGLSKELISAPRLDDVSSVFAIMEGMKAAEANSRGVQMGIVFDHEEIGSNSKQGAASTVLPTLLEKIYLSLGYERADYLSAIQDSLLCSVDVAQGVHPNYKEKYDPTNRPILNGGFCIKEASKQSYATDSEAVAIMQQLCDANKIPYQKCVNRSDMPSGGTLGSIASAVLPVRTIDMGIPLLSMHSSRELAGKEDIISLAECMKAFFTA